MQSVDGVSILKFQALILLKNVSARNVSVFTVLQAMPLLAKQFNLVTGRLVPTLEKVHY